MNSGESEESDDTEWNRLKNYVNVRGFVVRDNPSRNNVRQGIDVTWDIFN